MCVVHLLFLFISLFVIIFNLPFPLANQTNTNNKKQPILFKQLITSTNPAIRNENLFTQKNRILFFSLSFSNKKPHKTHFKNENSCKIINQRIVEANSFLKQQRNTNETQRSKKPNEKLYKLN